MACTLTQSGRLVYLRSGRREGEPVMRSSKTVHIVSCHAEGEVGEVIVGGVAPPRGASVWSQSRALAEDETLRNFMLNEPRGGVFRHVNLLVPSVDPRAATGWIIMEPAHNPPMSGSNGIASPRCCWKPASSRWRSRRPVSCWSRRAAWSRSSPAVGMAGSKPCGSPMLPRSSTGLTPRSRLRASARSPSIPLWRR